MTKAFIPPEWHRHAELWCGWPHLRGEWGGAFEGARAEIAGFIEAAARYTSVTVACGSDEAEQSARDVLNETPNVSFARISTGDIWLRDTGPILDSAGFAHCFDFNGWGGKYVMPGDTETAAAMASHLQLKSRVHPFILEGGAIDVDGAGNLLTTRQCLLNANRNGWSEAEAEAEAALKSALGADRIIWLDRGLLNDHTDGHIDNIARFIGPEHVLCHAPSGMNDPNAALYEAIYSALKDEGLTVSTLPSPGLVLDQAGEAAPASHLNFVFVNGAVIVPIYEDTNSAAAIKALETLLPGRDIVALPANHILSGGGSFHCMTREVPSL